MRRVSFALARDALADAVALARMHRLRLLAAAARQPLRRVLVLAVQRTEAANILPAALAELHRSRHTLRIETSPAEAGGKFENLNQLLAREDPAAFDWILAIDDDVALPRGFLDVFVFLAERFDLALAQPAHRAHSHAAWSVTRRQIGTVARETALVEIGPVTAFHRRTFETLLPFPQSRFGWGLDLYWAAIAAERGWRCGVIDATAIAHRLRPVASGYPREEAIAEAQQFLTTRPFVPAVLANRTRVTYRGWR